MEWTDEAIVLSSRPHGENAAVVTLLTEMQGRHAGLVSGGQGQKAQALFQLGNRVKAKWRARLPEQLGHYSCDLISSHAAAWLDYPEILLIISSACAVTEAGLPERQSMPGVYAGLGALLALTAVELWGPAYVKWEMGLLRALGYGLDLTQCAVHGSVENLAYISPRTGRAVSMEAGAPYHEKLFPLPAFLLGGDWETGDIRQGLDVTGYFLSRHVFAHAHSRLLIAQPGELPFARQRLLQYYVNLLEKSPQPLVISGARA